MLILLIILILLFILSISIVSYYAGDITRRLWLIDTLGIELDKLKKSTSNCIEREMGKLDIINIIQNKLFMLHNKEEAKWTTKLIMEKAKLWNKKK